MNESAEMVIRASLVMHPNIVSITNDDVVHLLHLPLPAVQGRTTQQAVQRVTVMQTAAQHIMLSLYRNQIMHVFIRSAMIALAVNSCKEEQLSLGKYYCCLWINIMLSLGKYYYCLWVNIMLTFSKYYCSLWVNIWWGSIPAVLGKYYCGLCTN